MTQTCCVEMVYSGTSQSISCPMGAKYEDIIKIAMERFSIPNEFTDFVRLYGGHRYIFDKYAFDKYLQLFPNPEMIFEIRVNYVELLDNLHLYARKPTKSIICDKRKISDENESVSVSKPNYFMESLTESLTDEPKVKRSKCDYSRESEGNMI